MLHEHRFIHLRYIETEDFYKDIAEDVEKRFDTSGYRYRPLPVGKNNKVTGLMKDKLGGEVMKEFISLRPKMYSYRVGNSEPKKCKGIKKCVIKKTITVCKIPSSFECASPSNFRMQGSFIHMKSRKIFERDLLSLDSVAKSATHKLEFSETDNVRRL